MEVFDTVRKDVGAVAQSAKEKVQVLMIKQHTCLASRICVTEWQYFVLQSVEVFDYVKKDFDEFTQTVQEEVSSTATALKEKLKV